MKVIRTNKEFIFNLFLYFNKEILEELIGFKINNLKLENSFYGRKIDIRAKGIKKDVFIETQITKSDIRHLKQIEFIIDNTSIKNRTVILWIADGFNNEILDDIENYIYNSNKNIEIISIDIVNGADNILETLGKIDEFDIVDNLWKLKASVKLDVFSRYFRVSPRKKSMEVLYNLPNQLTEIEIIMAKVLKEIRRQIFYFPTVHREKKLDSNSLVIGTGISDINYEVSLNRNSELLVEIRFTQNTKWIFEKLLVYKDEMEDCLAYTIQWNYDLYKIYSLQKYNNKDDRVIKQQVRVLENIIKYFNPFMNSVVSEIYNVK